MTRSISILVLAAALTPGLVAAQAGPYPAMQPTRIVTREYNFALAKFDGGTALIAQWREGLDAPGMQLTADLGVADFDGASGIMLGGTMNYQLATATVDLPFDMVIGGGVSLMHTDNVNTMRVPVGVAVGRTFPLERGYAVTPFVHPRVSVDRIKADGVRARNESNISVDVGASFEYNLRIQLRMAVDLGEQTSVSIGLAYLPRGLRDEPRD